MVLAVYFCFYLYLQIFSTYINVWAVPSQEMELLVTAVCLIFTRVLDRLTTQKPSYEQSHLISLGREWSEPVTRKTA